MSVVYVDTSCLVAVAFDEPEVHSIRARLLEATVPLSSNLLEAEYRSTLAREKVAFQARSLAWMRWVLPDRPLGPEIGRVLDVGFARGADLWHLAVALYVSPAPSELLFLTLDERQRTLAESLGFST
ncbi:MAG: PIN domain-containing protein [Gemmatimonadota bacterium]|nr:PIN domain-containing protein [Gemmatimonadota bacterium]